MSITLYCFGESGNAYKVALMLELTGQAWEPHFVDFFHGEARGQAFQALNEMAEVPVLVDGDVRLSQSGAILSYLAEKAGRFGGETAEEKREILRWLLWDNHKFSTQIGTTRFLMNFLNPEKRPAEVIAFQQARLKSAYAVLERHLETRDFILGQAPSIADLSLCAYLYYPEPFGFLRADWPKITLWLDRIAALPSWKHPYELMPGNPSDRAEEER